jgi:hypothetical protein
MGAGSMRSTEFRGIASAPRDGTLIDVKHGPDQVIVLPRSAGQNQAFVRDDDPLRRTLDRVSLWRPAKPGARAGQGASDSGRSGAANRTADPASAS